jgi:AcrR family transcriptional regulator
MATVAGARQESTRARILGAATTLFARHGFRRTSIDLLAAEADVAKPTVYAYFENKEEVFRAVVGSLCDSILVDAESACRRGGSLEGRLAAVLSAKLTRSWSLVHASPHARELTDAKDELGAETIARFDGLYLNLVASLLASAQDLSLDRLGLTPLKAARLFLRAASGAMYDATSEEAHRQNLGEIVRTLVAGMRRAPRDGRRTRGAKLRLRGAQRKTKRP